jgi:DNA-binding GntR family transcriptional regulator
MQQSFSKKRQKQANPIPSLTDVDRVRRAIVPNIRDLLLFNLAVETGVAANQLLSLYVKDLAGLNVGEKISVLSGKQDRNDPVVMGQQTHETFQHYLQTNRPMADELLFKSRKGNGALSLSSASRLASGWFDQVGLKGMSGFLSLRKTWEMYYQPSAKEKNGNSSSLGSEPAYSAKVIQTSTTQELVYKELEHAIVTARIKPGEKLITEKLAQQMGVSRIPVREAIGRLAARDFVTIQPNKGVTVNELSEKNLKEILKIRLMLELPAAKQATLNMKDGLLNRLAELTDQYLKAHSAHNANDLLKVNYDFHFTIYREARMPILLSIIKNLWKQVSPYYHIMFRQTLFLDPKSGPDYHQKVIDGMKNRDPEAVCHWIKVDLVEAAEFVMGVMRSMKSEEEII